MASIPQTAFGDHLDSLLSRRGLSVRAFGRLVGLPVTSISAAKRRRMPPRHIDAWADALALGGEDRRTFVRLAWLSHAPAQVQAMISALEAQVRELGGCPWESQQMGPVVDPPRRVASPGSRYRGTQKPRRRQPKA